MEDCKEFQGKTLDEAIHSACVYFDAPREKLEIEIVEDAKSGLFGIVGVRKAKIRARRVSLKGSIGKLLDGEIPSVRPHAEEAVVSPKPSETSSVKSTALSWESEKAAAAKNTESEETPVPEVQPASDSLEPRSVRRRQPRAADAGNTVPHTKSRRPAEQQPAEAEEDEGNDRSERRVPFEELDQGKLQVLAEETARQLVMPILGEAPISVSIGNGHVSINVECGDKSGLLIGREGQTLSSLQYLASRIISTGMGASVRVQFNAGDYRDRQDERLRELAFVLAERVRATGRVCSTRPMSSYHRRIIHLALQDSPDVQTRSSGEGPLKRIIVQKKKSA